LPEFDITVLTVRSGTHTVRIQADDASAARAAVESEWNEDRGHCPAHWCTDDVQSEIVQIRPVPAADRSARSSASTALESDDCGLVYAPG
jgi:hypothetical protein